MARPCACRRAPESDGSFLAACRIPPRYEEASLQNFDVDASNRVLVAALETCIVYCANYPQLDSTHEGLGLLFTGPNGVGKTHLAVGVLRELWSRKGVRGQFWDFQELIRLIRHSYNPEIKTTELQVLEPIIEMDVLLLDDLGAWKITDWVNDTLFYILNSRYQQKRATIITTNFEDVDRDTAVRADKDAEDSGMLSRKREFLLERIGLGARSRLMEMCTVVRMTGPDYRQARQELNKMLLRAGGGTPKERV